MKKYFSNYISLQLQDYHPVTYPNIYIKKSALTVQLINVFNNIENEYIRIIIFSRDMNLTFFCICIFIRIDIRIEA